jgi:hypothetical protein
LLYLAFMPNITEEELTLLKNVKTAREWDDACDAIKGARNGVYPSDWWAKVMQSGLYYTVSGRFQG